jgi:Protein of unknown function (DUF1573)
MKKISSILFLATMISFVACKDAAKTGEAAGETAATGTETVATGTPSTDVTVPAGDITATTTTTPAPAVGTPDAAATVDAAKPTGPITKIEILETTYDFGTVKDGEKVKHVYKFKNTGKEPLIISDAKGSCGCTVPDWPREPIAPGKMGEIKVEFDSKNKGTEEGSPQVKKVTLTANTDPVQSFLTIKGIVKKDKAK